MYKITKRISNGSTIVGYVLTDDIQEMQMDKPSVINLAKQGLIANVKVSGDTISGTNGFELKALPTINLKQNHDGEIKVHEKLAAVARNLDKIGKVPSLESIETMRQIGEMGNQIIQQELNSGRLRLDMLHANSNNIQIIRKFTCTKIPSLTHYLKNFDSIPEQAKEQMFEQILNKLTVGLTLENIERETVTLVINSLLPILGDKLETTTLPSYVGYLVRVSPNLRTSLNYKKLKYGTGEVLGDGTLYADSVELMTKAELVLLASRPTMSGQIGDFKLSLSSRKVAPTTNWEYLQNHIFRCETREQDVLCTDVTDLKQILEPDVLSRFIPDKNLKALISELTNFFIKNGINKAENALDAMGFKGDKKKLMLAVVDRLEKLGKAMEALGASQGSVEIKVDRDKVNIKSTSNTPNKKKGLLGMFKR